MRCAKCGERAQVELRRHNSAYCAPHYLDFFQAHVERNIHSKKMFHKEDKVLVAVSGGKDSLALWDVLQRLGYEATGLYIDLGISDYSTRSREKAQAFADKTGARLIVKDVRELYGGGETGITELAKALRRVPCSGCGLTKRYITNQAARELGFTVLATGHNLDDEVATLMGNVLHWQMGYLARQSPVLESTHAKLAKKVKPLYTFTERETLAYTLLRRIDYIEEECPNALGAESIGYKEAVHAIDDESPGTKSQFLQVFLDRARALIPASDDVDLGECVHFGEPTTAELCAFCRMWQRAQDARQRRKRPLPLAEPVPPPVNQAPADVLQ